MARFPKNYSLMDSLRKLEKILDLGDVTLKELGAFQKTYHVEVRRGDLLVLSSGNSLEEAIDNLKLS